MLQHVFPTALQLDLVQVTDGVRPARTSRMLVPHVNRLSWSQTPTPWSSHVVSVSLRPTCHVVTITTNQVKLNLTCNKSWSMRLGTRWPLRSDNFLTARLLMRFKLRRTRTVDSTMVVAFLAYIMAEREWRAQPPQCYGAYDCLPLTRQNCSGVIWSYKLRLYYLLLIKGQHKTSAIFCTYIVDLIERHIHLTL